MLKPLDRLLHVDPRHAIEVKVDAEGNVYRATLEDYYHRVGAIELHPGVPTETRNLFDIARNVFAYSWFSYELATTAELHALTILEESLRNRLVRSARNDRAAQNIRNMGLSKLLDVAKGRKLIAHSDFTLPPALQGGPKRSSLDYIIAFRNELAHGKWHLLPALSVIVLETCAEVLNRLYDNEG